MENGKYKTKDSVFWYLNGKLHREDGPAFEEIDGTTFWFISGKRHRENGPAVEWSDGSKQWYLNDKLHREDGPAIDNANGTKQWHLYGRQLSLDEFNQWLEKKNLSEKLQSTLKPKHRDKKNKI
jgi:hypothetical protein